MLYDIVSDARDFSSEGLNFGICTQIQPPPFHSHRKRFCKYFSTSHSKFSQSNEQFAKYRQNKCFGAFATVRELGTYTRVAQSECNYLLRLSLYSRLAESQAVCLNGTDINGFECPDITGLFTLKKPFAYYTCSWCISKLPRLLLSPFRKDIEKHVGYFWYKGARRVLCVGAKKSDNDNRNNKRRFLFSLAIYGQS
ncbi:hypothetical protein PHYBLDRAFT_68274 [Phycomyces blakesleeanus NRRL 1555(-)]|uniref:Uncharacterized protein n=1 Tax=Phycomyces blakesleeanus (strain ATCC 8743b / DSM 1359 / FGSC 10004 / NBRC 33097 / NRRL 1555) TaxID=763407 RepID=A0A162NC43_PHYB8|nr:hypothetical protein PHYBLDRAFT_68274 [Phycomyces blakesleeanus NRRL 1555(-)]OAD67904.1 hypothetical protein PHYBLDRAFT_68274 [Phycomyces blakesleeanus NRRL 1555(-)]|eukprot:XP_018285944.1 hypothetical protein PHYBLDRAFT_68274 [Phycomyces blakesleeanus NRRL 1555(-)]